MKKFISLFYALVLFAGLTTVAKAADPIRIPVLNWSSQIVTAHVMKQAFEELGYDVELVPAESATRYEAVRVGELHVAHETWQSTMAKPMYEAMDKGGLIDAGSHPAPTLEDMGVPQWVIDENLCPGLPNWEALKSDECVANFATPDSEGKGRWLEGPYEWHTDVMPNRLKGLGLDDKWIGRKLGVSDVEELISISSKFRFNSDGEGGEYETLVLDSPHMKRRITLDGEMSWQRNRGSWNITSGRLTSNR